MGTIGSTRLDARAGATAGTAAPGSLVARVIPLIENFAPYIAGALLLLLGLYSCAVALGAPLAEAPVTVSPLSAALLVAAAGLGIIIAAWEVHGAKQALARAQRDLARAQAQREFATLQVRQTRIQADGLALMREIHRSTAIPDRDERLHRILTLLADLFEAHEVALFAADSHVGDAVQPAAGLKLTGDSELFIAFEACAFPQKEPLDSSTATANVGLSQPRVARDSAVVVREGPRVCLKGTVTRDTVQIAKIRCRFSHQSAPERAGLNEPAGILDTALAQMDLGPSACRFARRALETRRTVRLETRAADSETLCVPLLADQRPIGVLRIRRPCESIDRHEAEALEELLLESAKHIALALKKDEDDRKAITDALTSLYIKRHLLETLDVMRAEATASGNCFCLVFCDIDHFKQVNDTYGHLTGDMVLKGVATVLRSGLRSGDMSFRYGGEELVLLLANCNLERAEQTAERLRHSVEKAVFTGEKGQHVPVTVSLGVAQHHARLGADELIGRADRAMYASKLAGRNRVTRWSAALAVST